MPREGSNLRIFHRLELLTPFEPHPAPGPSECLPGNGSGVVCSSFQYVTHFVRMGSKIFGTLTEGSEFPHEAVGEDSLAVDAPPAPGPALLLDVRNEGRIGDQFVECEDVTYLGALLNLT